MKTEIKRRPMSEVLKMLEGPDYIVGYDEIKPTVEAMRLLADSIEKQLAKKKTVKKTVKNPKNRETIFEDESGERITLSVPEDHKFIVVEFPWQQEPYCASKHQSFSAAEKAASKNYREFKRRYPNGYGYSWVPYTRVGFTSET